MIDRRPSTIAATAFAGVRYFKIGVAEVRAHATHMLTINRVLRADAVIAALYGCGVRILSAR